MKALIVSSSTTGNTRKLAEAIQASLPPGSSDLQTFADGADPGGYDLVFVGFSLQKGKAEPKAEQYLRGLGRVKVFLFATHGAGKESEHARTALAAARDLAGSGEIVGTFNCQGEVKPDFLATAKAKSPPPPWVDDADSAVGHPDDEDIAALRKTLARILDES